MGGQGSGPQKKPATLIKDAKEQDAKNLPKYFIVLSELALKGDREALFYLIDRHLGKSKIHTDITTGGERLESWVQIAIIDAVDARQRLGSDVTKEIEGTGVP